ncbi:MAG: hypothetical protein JNK52_08315 [Zoogloeaceae bacterium]|nr:hypothetical protein [Zoogloeaceae bacterium]
MVPVDAAGFYGTKSLGNRLAGGAMFKPWADGRGNQDARLLMARITMPTMWAAVRASLC